MQLSGDCLLTLSAELLALQQGAEKAPETEEELKCPLRKQILLFLFSGMFKAKFLVFDIRKVY